jgi:hypothetical protein
VILTNATTKVALAPIVIKSSTILATPGPVLPGGVQLGGQQGPVTTTVTMGPNGPVVNVGPGPGPGGGPPPAPAPAAIDGTTAPQAVTPAPAPPAPTPPPAAPPAF